MGEAKVGEKSRGSSEGEGQECEERGHGASEGYMRGGMGAGQKAADGGGQKCEERGRLGAWRGCTLKDAAGEESTGVATPPVKDIMVIPHHDLGYAGQCVGQVHTAPMLPVVSEVEVRCLLGHRI